MPGGGDRVSIGSRQRERDNFGRRLARSDPDWAWQPPRFKGDRQSQLTAIERYGLLCNVRIEPIIMAPMPVDIPQFATEQLSLLSAELAAETTSTTSLLASTSPTALSRAGLAIINLVVSSQRTGLGGKTVLELEQDHAIGSAGEISEHGIRTGDIVRVGEQPKGNEKKKEKAGMEGRGVEGVVVRVHQKGVQVALGREEDDAEGLGGRLWV